MIPRTGTSPPPARPVPRAAAGGDATWRERESLPSSPDEPAILAGDTALWSGASHLRRLHHRHPLVTDAVLTLVLAALTTAALAHKGSTRADAAWLVFSLNLALVLPLAFRRRAPSLTFAAIVAVAAVQWLVAHPLPGDVAILLALYTVAAHESRRRALVAAGVVEVGVVLAAVRFSPARGIVASMVFLSGLLAAAVFIGTTVRTRRAYLTAIVDRAARLERERDQQAQLAATAERTRIAREMHDIVAHSLSVVISLADGAALVNRDPDQASAVMRQVAEVGRQALGETRRLLGVLRDDGFAAELVPRQASCALLCDAPIKIPQLVGV
jgi:signal transduction histidine kinase